MPKTLKIAAPVLIVAVAVALAVLLARSGGEPEKQEPEQAALLVDVVEPRIEEGRFRIRAQGTVTPRIETDLVSEVSGKVVWMSEDFVSGGVFSEGQVLARIDPSDYETALLAAEAELAVVVGRTCRDVPEERVDEVVAGYVPVIDMTAEDIARAKAAVQAQEAAVERARRNLERTRITLPFNGMIRERSVDLGQYVTTGSDLGLAFSTDRAEVRLPLSETDLAFLDLPFAESGRTIDRPVTLIGSVAGQPSRWDATLVRTEGVVDRNTRLTYAVARVDDPYALDEDADRPPLPIGTFVEADIVGRDASGLVVLPTEALHDGDTVYLANDEDELEVRAVDVVRTTPQRVYVSGSLNADDRVITTAIPAPVPGLKLNVRNVAETEPRLRILPAGELAANDRAGNEA